MLKWIKKLINQWKEKNHKNYLKKILSDKLKVGDTIKIASKEELIKRDFKYDEIEEEWTSKEEFGRIIRIDRKMLTLNVLTVNGITTGEYNSNYFSVKEDYKLNEGNPKIDLYNNRYHRLMVERVCLKI
jgi:hypothetical protein